MSAPRPGLATRFAIVIAFHVGASPVDAAAPPAPRDAIAAVAPTAPAATTVHVPFVVGLTTVRAVSTPAGDYETLRVVESIDAAGYAVTTSAEVPGDDGEMDRVKVLRRVPSADQAGSHRVRIYFDSEDPPTFVGTVPGFSAAMVDELTRFGRAPITFLEASSLFGASAITREFEGVVARTAAPATVPMLVNGRLRTLPVVHAKGVLTDGRVREPFEFVVLADAANPIVLQLSGNGIASKIVRIEYPEPRAAPGSIESALGRNEVVKVYGIYFAFGKAELRPESDRVLGEIGALAKAHPDWTLRIDGHTDSVGNDAANLDLSRRRAAAVKAALVSRFGVEARRLSTGGYGEASPQDTNDTADGRARNRRVELRRG